MSLGALVDACPCCTERLRVPLRSHAEQRLDCPQCGESLLVDAERLHWPDAPSPPLVWQPILGGLTASACVVAAMVPTAAACRTTPLPERSVEVRPLGLVALEPVRQRPVDVPMPEPDRNRLPIEVPLAGVGEGTSSPPMAPPPRPRAAFVAPADLEPLLVPVAADRFAETEQKLAIFVRGVHQPKAIPLAALLGEIAEMADVTIDSDAAAHRIDGLSVRVSGDNLTLGDLLTKSLAPASLTWTIRWDGAVAIAANDGG